MVMTHWEVLLSPVYDTGASVWTYQEIIKLRNHVFSLL